jgi:prepilin-type processing-associated H-X9-DG protein
MNPGIDALIKVPLAAGEDAIAIGNSPNHGGDGQNVLYGDGHVEFQGSPYVGVERDNIYTYGDSGTEFTRTRRRRHRRRSVGPNDSILLPTAQGLGVDRRQRQAHRSRQKRRLGVSRHEARHAAAAGRDEEEARRQLRPEHRTAGASSCR